MLLPPALGFSHPPVSVYGTGTYKAIAPFSSAHGSHTSLLCFAPRHAFGLSSGFANWTPTTLAPVFPFPGCALHMRPHSSVYMRYRNLNLLSIGYVFRPLLRPRLTQSRSALLWKPWIFGREDSHLSLATHSGILSYFPPLLLPVQLRRS